jgi:dynein heavy chain
MGILQPMNIFLRQEIDRMQKVITLVRQTLKDLKLAIDGTIIMSEDLRDALDNMFDARVPNKWKKISWESATLGFWFTDLLERNVQFRTWLLDGRPHSFWMTGFFNPQVCFYRISILNMNPIENRGSSILEVQSNLY